LAYFNRYNPQLAKEGKNPFSLDSKEPKLDYETFLKMKSVIVLSFRIIRTWPPSYLLKPKKKPEKGLNTNKKLSQDMIPGQGNLIKLT